MAGIPRSFPARGVIARLGSCQGSLPRLQALFEKELRYLVRNGPMLFRTGRAVYPACVFPPVGKQGASTVWDARGPGTDNVPLAASLVLLGFMESRV